jgi:hypothetical protein
MSLSTASVFSNLPMRSHTCFAEGHLSEVISKKEKPWTEPTWVAGQQLQKRHISTPVSDGKFATREAQQMGQVGPRTERKLSFRSRTRTQTERQTVA